MNHGGSCWDEYNHTLSEESYTVRKTVTRVDEISPNRISMQLKLCWLSGVEFAVFLEVHTAHLRCVRRKCAQKRLRACKKTYLDDVNLKPSFQVFTTYSS